MRTIIYLHGFNSSPFTKKAQILRRAVDQRADLNFLAPQLATSVELVFSQLSELIQQQAYPVALVGSSLGGFISAYFAEKYNLKAVLINPAVYAYGAVGLIGEHVHPVTKKAFSIAQQDLDFLASFDVPCFLHPENIMMLLQTGDEVLDYQCALTKYPNVRQLVQEGGSHQFENFPDVVDDVLKFLISS